MAQVFQNLRVLMTRLLDGSARYTPGDDLRPCHRLLVPLTAAIRPQPRLPSAALAAITVASTTTPTTPACPAPA